jgi:hypothetical protein
MHLSDDGQNVELGNVELGNVELGNVEIQITDAKLYICM